MSHKKCASMKTISYENEQQARELIAQSCTALDTERFDDFLQLCLPGFQYRTTAYSPEIRRDMVWLEHDKAGIQELLELLPKQNRDRTPITRHFSIYSVGFVGVDVIKVDSMLQIYRTELDGGITSVFAVGKYHDTLALDNGSVAGLLSREVRLDTRMLGTGYHIPF